MGYDGVVPHNDQVERWSELLAKDAWSKSALHLLAHVLTSLLYSPSRGYRWTPLPTCM